MFSKTRIMQLRTIVAAASPGPWSRAGCADDLSIASHDTEALVADVQFERDHVFICEARTELTRLLDEVERLQQENAQLRRANDMRAGPMLDRIKAVISDGESEADELARMRPVVEVARQLAGLALDAQARAGIAGRTLHDLYLALAVCDGKAPR